MNSDVSPAIQGLFTNDNFLNTTFPVQSNLRYSFTFTVLLSTIVGLLSLCTILGNSTVILSFIRDKKLRKIRNYYILNLAICDLGIGSFVTITALINELFLQWQFGLPFCKLWLCADYVLLCESILTLLLICWDRLLLTTKPLQYMTQQTSRHALMKIMITWGCSILLQCPIILLEELFDTHQGSLVKCYVQVQRYPVFIGLKTTLQFIIPLILMIGMIAQIFRNIHYKTLKYSSRQKVIRFREGSGQINPIVLRTVSKLCSTEENISRSTRKNLYPHLHNHSSREINSDKIVSLQCTCRNRTFNCGFSQVAALSVQYSVLPIDWWPWKNQRFPTNNQLNNLLSNHHVCSNDNPNIMTQTKSRWPKKATIKTKSNSIPKNGIRGSKFIILKQFLVTIVTVHTLCWFPYIIGEFTQIICKICINDAAHRFLYWGLYYNSTINPFLYAIILKRFSLNFHKIWCSWIPEWDKESTCSEMTARALA